MMERLKGTPFRSTEGDLRISSMNGTTSPNEFVYACIKAVPTIMVLKHVNPKRATFTQGNFRSGACSNKISAGGLNELSMKILLLLFSASVGPAPCLIGH